MALTAQWTFTPTEGFRMIQGLSAVFWGLPMMSVFGFYFAINMVFDFLSFILTMAGAVLNVAGCGILAGSTFSRRNAPAASQWLWFFGVFPLAFAPFLYFWRRLPGNFYFSLNSLLFIISIFCFLIILNIWLVVMARHANDRLFYRETLIFGVVAVLFILLPVGWIAFVTLSIARFFKQPHLAVIAQLLHDYRLHLIIVLIIPFSTTLSLMWNWKMIFQTSMRDQLSKFEPKSFVESSPRENPEITQTDNISDVKTS